MFDPWLLGNQYCGLGNHSWIATKDTALRQALPPSPPEGQTSTLSAWSLGFCFVLLVLGYTHQCSGLFLALHSGNQLSRLRGHFGVLEIKLRSSEYKANDLPAVLSFWFQNPKFKN